MVATGMSVGARDFFLNFGIELKLELVMVVVTEEVAAGFGEKIELWLLLGKGLDD